MKSPRAEASSLDVLAATLNWTAPAGAAGGGPVQVPTRCAVRGRFGSACRVFGKLQGGIILGRDDLDAAIERRPRSRLFARREPRGQFKAAAQQSLARQNDRDAVRAAGFK